MLKPLCGPSSCVHASGITAHQRIACNVVNNECGVEVIWSNHCGWPQCNESEKSSVQCKHIIIPEIKICGQLTVRGVIVFLEVG